MKKSLTLLSLIVSSVIITAGCGAIAQSVRNDLKQKAEAAQPIVRPKLPPAEDVAVSSEPLNWKDDEFPAFSKAVYSLMKKRDFDGLDAMASKFRNDKERFQIGGGWKIHSFYKLTSAPEIASEDGWREHIKLLEDWKAAKPKSIAARASLGSAHGGHAWHARGTGYANEIPPEAMTAVETRMQRAARELEDASNLEEKCYGLYEALLRFGRGAGVERSWFDKVFDEAVAYDPSYQYFYSEKAQYLMPRWYGRPGELEAFVDNLVVSKGAEDGSKLYYLIISDLYDYKQEKGNELFGPQSFSWKRTKKGFVQLEEDYGITRARLNQFARMSLTGRDAQAQCNTFKRLQGENDFDPGEWNNREDFEMRKKLALETICKIPAFGNALD